MGRTRVRRRRLVLLMAVALIGAAWAAPGVKALGHEVRSAREHYVVRAGDTLWTTADRIEPSEDPRAVVDAIAGLNGISAGDLVPGQEIVLPSGEDGG